ncbi:MAG: type II toxin-antitoxin system RatA family toxin [Halothiobacillaceae bacterium]
MTTIRRNVTVPYSAEQMYRLVNDVESYPDFLPWCERTELHRADANHVEASITLRKGSIRKRFSTRNELDPGREIRIHLVDGPFRRLEGSWRFRDLEQGGSLVLLEMQFEFSSRLLDLAIGPVFREIVGSLVNSFRRRADEVYTREVPRQS